MQKRHGHYALIAIVAAAAVAVAVVVSGCGSGSEGGSSSTASGKIDTSAAKQDFEKWQKPTAWGELPHFKSPPPTGKKLIVATCGTSQCLPEPEILQEEVAPILGWSVKIEQPAGLTPASEQAIVSQAVREKPDGIVIQGLNSVVVATQIKEAKAAGIAVVLSETSDPNVPPMQTTVPGPENPSYTLQAEMMAASVVASTEGEPKVLFVNFPYFTIYRDVNAPQFMKAMAKFCPGCEVKELKLPPTAIGSTALAQITNFLRANPQLNSVVNLLDASQVGLPASLAGAGLSGKVKIFGFYPSEGNYPMIKSGEETAGIVVPFHEEMYAVADRFARVFAEEEVEASLDVEIPQIILTESNLKEMEQLHRVDPNTRKYFEEIWGVSKG